MNNYLLVRTHLSDKKTILKSKDNISQRSTKTGIAPFFCDTRLRKEESDCGQAFTNMWRTVVLSDQASVARD